MKRIFTIALMLVCGISLQAQYNTGIGDGYARGIVTNFEIPNIVAIPSLTAPINSAINVSSNPTLSWVASANAISYQVQVSTTNDFDTPTINEVITSTSFELTALTTNTQYVWRVQAINGELTSQWSEVRSFTTTVQSDPTYTTLNLEVLLQGYWNNIVHKEVAVTIELRTGTSLLSSSLYRRIPILISSNGVATAGFNEFTTGDYWIIVRSAGYLGIASKFRQTITAGSTVNYDFTRSTNNVYNSGTLKPYSGRYIMKVGDLNNDKNINGSDGLIIKNNTGGSTSVPNL